jgi:hypothetical protein
MTGIRSRMVAVIEFGVSRAWSMPWRAFGSESVKLPHQDCEN